MLTLELRILISLELWRLTCYKGTHWRCTVEAYPTSILFLLKPKKVLLEWWMFTLVSGLLLELRRLTIRVQ
jgi:hypothetical protein